MSYQVLALKWRPQNFQDMVGQQHVLKALINALDNQRLHHAYLFTGTRGVGKTTIARIFAKALNCEQGVSATPCGSCSACMAITEGHFVDLIEVDAASRTKVEDTRELLDNVQYKPTRGRYKVYLIDEVHMLSGHSFNALLKTLEEPPEHVKFLLATTDPQKLPVTVLSRCLQFNLKNMLPEQIIDHLQHILNDETIPADNAALWQLANAADGSMRDALSLLDQAIAFGNGEVSEAQVAAMLGTLNRSQIQALIHGLTQGDASSLLATCREIAENNGDFHQATENLLHTIHEIALAQFASEAIQGNMHEREFITQMAQAISREDIQLYYQIGLQGRRDLPYAPSAKRGFEMIILRMLAFKPAPQDSKKKTNRQEPVAKPVASAVTQTAPATPSISVAAKPEVEKPVQAVQAPTQPSPAEPKVTPEPPASNGTSEWPITNWERLVPKLGLSGMSLALANHAAIQSQEGDRLVLSLDPDHAPLLSPNCQGRIAKALESHFSKPVKLNIEVSEPTTSTPAQIKSAAESAALEKAQNSLETDPKLNAVIERFDAKLDQNSIKAID